MENNVASVSSKEELKKKFEATDVVIELMKNGFLYQIEVEFLFDFFWSEIVIALESGEKLQQELTKLRNELKFEIGVANSQTEINKELSQENYRLLEELSRLRSLVKAAEPSQPERTAELPDVIKFLLGEGSLNGVWYGDPRPDNEKGNFWWRKYLRKAMQEYRDQKTKL